MPYFVKKIITCLVLLLISFICFSPHALYSTVKKHTLLEMTNEMNVDTEYRPFKIIYDTDSKSYFVNYGDCIVQFNENNEIKYFYPEEDGGYFFDFLIDDFLYVSVYLQNSTKSYIRKINFETKAIFWQTELLSSFYFLFYSTSTSILLTGNSLATITKDTGSVLMISNTLLNADIELIMEASYYTDAQILYVFFPQWDSIFQLKLPSLTLSKNKINIPSSIDKNMLRLIEVNSIKKRAILLSKNSIYNINYYNDTLETLTLPSDIIEYPNKSMSLVSTCKKNHYSNPYLNYPYFVCKSDDTIYWNNLDHMTFIKTDLDSFSMNAKHKNIASVNIYESYTFIIDFQEEKCRLIINDFQEENHIQYVDFIPMQNFKTTFISTIELPPWNPFFYKENENSIQFLLFLPGKIVNYSLPSRK